MLTTELAARMCHACSADTVVYKSWEDERGRIVRRRICPKCGACHETLESYRKPAKIYKKSFVKSHLTDKGKKSI